MRGGAIACVRGGARGGLVGEWLGLQYYTGTLSGGGGARTGRRPTTRSWNAMTKKMHHERKEGRIRGQKF